MTTALSQDGGTVTITAAAALTKDYLYALGPTGGAQDTDVVNGLPAVAVNSYTTGDSAVFLTEGVFTLSKKAEANSALVVGQKAFWRATGGVNEITGLATAADGVAGVAWQAAATGGTTAVVKLLGFGSYAAI